MGGAVGTVGATLAVVGILSVFGYAGFRIFSKKTFVGTYDAHGLRRGYTLNSGQMDGLDDDLNLDHDGYVPPGAATSEFTAL